MKAILWDLFQLYIGANDIKKNAIRKILKNKHKKILEIGCATGNLSNMFVGTKKFYVGYDINKESIKFALKKFKKYKNIKFTHNIKNFNNEVKFDLILMPSILHHISDNKVREIFNKLKKVISKTTNIYVAEPLKLSNTSNILNKFFLHFFERGKFLRGEKEYLSLLRKYMRVQKKNYFITHALGSYYGSRHLCLFGSFNN